MEGAEPGMGGHVQSEGERGVSPADILRVPEGARRAKKALNTERAPEIIPLREPAAIQEKGIKGKAARYAPETAQLFVNLLYPSVFTHGPSAVTRAANESPRGPSRIPVHVGNQIRT